MDFSRVDIYRAEFKDLKNGLQSQRLYIEIVMIDQSLEGGKSMLYQLNKDKLTGFENINFFRQEFISLPHPAFTLLGSILEINLAKKCIYLNDGYTITYKHMILVSGVNAQDEAGTVLHTLKEALMLDALNLKDQILKPSSGYSFSNKGNNKHTNPSHSFCVPNTTLPLLNRSLHKIAHNKIMDSACSQPPAPRSSSQKKLCFLQM